MSQNLGSSFHARCFFAGGSMATWVIGIIINGDGLSGHWKLDTSGRRRMSVTFPSQETRVFHLAPPGAR